MKILSINILDIGQKLTNIELYEIFGCGNSGGMRRAKKTNSLIIISSHGKHPANTALPSDPISLNLVPT